MGAILTSIKARQDFIESQISCSVLCRVIKPGSSVRNTESRKRKRKGEKEKDGGGGRNTDTQGLGTLCLRWAPEGLVVAPAAAGTWSPGLSPLPDGYFINSIESERWLWFHRW